MRTILLLFLFFIIAACSIPGDQATPTTNVATSLPSLPATPTFISPPPTPGVISEPTEAEATLPGSTNTTQASPVPDTLTPQPTAVLELPDPAAYAWQEIAGSLRAPVGLENAGDGSGRMFVLEQEGIIRIIQGGAVLDPPFLDIRDRVGSQASEQGLLGIAFHPQYPENGFFYINYTDQSGDTVIARFQVSPEDPSLADRDSETRLLQLSQPFANHNGGVIKFGPDGSLYLGLGDGGGGGDPQNNAQSLDTLLGKVLRIDVDGGEPYAIPADNPFASGGGRPEIWAYGLRNPWRFSFDRLTGDLYIADVGQNTWEEVNFQPAGSPGGENYGWDTMEGFDCFNAANCNMEGLTLPVVTYPTRGDGNCSVTGGYVYRGSLAEWQGVYLFGDYCSGRVWGLLRNAQGDWVHSLLFENVARISSFGEDEAGEVYLVDHSGSIFHLVAR